MEARAGGAHCSPGEGPLAPRPDQVSGPTREAGRAGAPRPCARGPLGQVRAWAAGPAPGSRLSSPWSSSLSLRLLPHLRPTPAPSRPRPLTLPPAPLPSRRNLSSADAGRQTMRNYTGLIDALMAYVQNCVAASRCDDKVTGWPQLAPPLGATAGLRAQPVPWLLSPVPVGTWLSDPDRTPPGGPGRQDTGRGGLCVQTPGWSPRGKGGLLEQRLAGCQGLIVGTWAGPAPHY